MKDFLIFACLTNSNNGFTLQLGIFIYHVIKLSNKGIHIDANGPAPVESRLIYNPYRRYEAWRYVTYMFVHAG